MYVRSKKNASGSISIQLISKSRGQYKVVKSFGSATTRQEIDRLKLLAEQEKDFLSKPQRLFITEKDKAVEEAFSILTNSNIRTVDPELIFGKIFDHIGFNAIDQDMFRHLVISRLTFPLRFTNE
ncbi:MAG: hypothetical protein GVY19_10180 [Bacteroidetes bacterium]|jgi:hypothetical protein|nr:hypothetical protein [Bacteroidota bacterium]